MPSADVWKHKELYAGVKNIFYFNSPLVFQCISISRYLFFQCGEKGHFATKCNKGYLAFLSDKAQTVQQPPQVDPQNLGL